jgi:hypothetical protein
MGATISLYRLSDAKFQNKGLFSIPTKECDKLTDDEFDKLWATKDIDRFEDGQAHNIVDITTYKRYYGDTRGWERVRDKFNRLPIQSGVVDCTGEVHNYIVADFLGEYSGRFLNRRYYKKDTWLILCTTKEEVVTCFKKYGAKGHDLVLNLILDQWDEKTFIVISY